MSNGGSFPRRHDLDALRAIAMLLGIALHGLLAYVPIPWAVQDPHQQPWLMFVFFLIHGFRMPLFFLVSGFFTAMLWRKRGLSSLIKHRVMRILVPCLVGVATIVPLMNVVSAFAAKNPAAANQQVGEDRSNRLDQKGVLSPVVYPQKENESAPTTDDVRSAVAVDIDIWRAASIGDVEALQYHLEQGVDINAGDAERQSTPLILAAFWGRQAAVEFLIQKGADLHVRNHDNATALDAARFAGHTKIVALLAEAMGEPAQTAKEENPGITGVYWWLILSDIWKIGGDPESFHLMLTPVFHHLWFLWFLCWLVVGFVVYAMVADVIGLKSLPKWLIVSPLRYLWLIPLTILPQMFMGSFGPDTSVGLIPYPHLLFYYAIFFGFGALYFDCMDTEGELGRRWFITIPLALLLFLVGVGLSTGDPGLYKNVDVKLHKPISVVIQVLFVWLMSFGLMGLFRRVMSGESKWMRYISDSSYWLYLAHLPLMIWMQWWIRDWNLNGLVKFGLVVGVCSGFLLVTYEYFIRYTPVGTMLNGKKIRPVRRTASESPEMR